MSALRSLAADINTAAISREMPASLPPGTGFDSIGAGAGHGIQGSGFPSMDRTSGRGDAPFVLFNTASVDREEIVHVTVWDSSRTGELKIWTRPLFVRGPDGRALSVQVVDFGGYWGHDFVVLSFPAKIPALGYAVYSVVRRDEEKALPSAVPEVRRLDVPHHCSYSDVERNLEGLENEFLKVEIDPGSGGIRRLTDKRSGIVLIEQEPGAGALEYEVEKAHGMSAWCIENAKAHTESPKLKNIKRISNGPWEATIEAFLDIHESSMSVVYQLKARDPKLYVTVKGTWFQRGTSDKGSPVLNYRIPLKLGKVKTRYEIPFGAVDRSEKNRQEVPAIQWAQVSGASGRKTAGILLLNDCKYGHSMDDNILRLTLIRSSYEPDILPEIGNHEIHMAIVPFAGNFAVSEAIKKGQAFNHPVRPVSTDIHQGALPVKGQFISITPGTVILSAVKRTESGDALLLRMFNPGAKHINAKVAVNDKSVARIIRAKEVDLMERPLSKSSARVKDAGVSVGIPAHGIVSLLVELGNRTR